ncbi:hypothetical protein EQV77_11075 [Halobacillus fulvus]|nr:hypothetical protein EQV77_11075 [Halobacillus fulvus]
MKKRIWFYILVAFQFLFLVIMSAGYYAMDAFGETIRLETAPVDPRDPFYGDYVTLAYEVEQVPESMWQGEEEVESGQQVFLVVEPNEEGVYELQSASDRKPETEGDEVALEARLNWHDEFGRTYQVDLGLNRYYIEENTGERFESGMDNRIVEIVLAPWGQKKIKSISME